LAVCADESDPICAAVNPPDDEALIVAMLAPMPARSALDSAPTSEAVRPE
jgi:hypothetical protein